MTVIGKVLGWMRMDAQPAACIAGFHSRSGLLTISKLRECYRRRRPANLHGFLMLHRRCLGHEGPSRSAINENACASHLQNCTRKQCQFTNTSEKLQSLDKITWEGVWTCGFAREVSTTACKHRQVVSCIRSQQIASHTHTHASCRHEL